MRRPRTGGLLALRQSNSPGRGSTAAGPRYDSVSLSEIDLSVGAVAGVGAFVIAELIAPPVNLVWWLGVGGGLLVCAAIGAFQGTLITRLHLPSFIVTLGGLLGLTGVFIELATIDKTAVGGVISISTTSPVYNLVNANMSPTLSWIVLIVALVVYGGVSISGAARRRARGLSAPPLSVVILKVALAAAGGVAIVIICTVNRGAGLFAFERRSVGAAPGAARDRGVVVPTGPHQARPLHLRDWRQPGGVAPSRHQRPTCSHGSLHATAASPPASRDWRTNRGWDRSPPTSTPAVSCCMPWQRR